MSLWSILARRSVRCSHVRSIFSSSCPSPRPPSFSAAAPSALRFFSHSSSTSAKVKENSSPSVEKLNHVLDSEIECAQKSDLLNQEVALPKNFPFEIVDNPGDEAVVLKRGFGNENIQVTVFMNLEEMQDLDDADEDVSEDDNNENMELSLSLVVTVNKGVSAFLEFGCSLNAKDLKIRTMALKSNADPDDQRTYQGPEFSDLDENLQKSLHKYLQTRGVDGSLFDFLHQYMQNKDEREYLTWLKNMKDFVGN